MTKISAVYLFIGLYQEGLFNKVDDYINTPTDLAIQQWILLCYWQPSLGDETLL